MGSLSDVVQADAARLPIRSESVDCIVTSPPYNLGMDYDGVDDYCPPDVYQARVEDWAIEFERVLVPGGRCFVNVPTDARSDPGGRGSSRWAPDLVWREALAAAGLDYRMLIVWEQFGKDASCSWGSWLSPNAPNVRGRHEVVLWFFRPPFARGRTGPNDCPTDAFLEITKSIWSFATAKRLANHPAPFPAELVRRCLWLATWPGDVVLDPFVGSGTTIYEARRLGRGVVGLELSAGYCREIAHRGEELQLFAPTTNHDQPTDQPTQQGGAMHDAKFTVEVREGHKPLEEDEPCFVLRAQDKLAADAILNYAALCRDAGCSEEHVTAIHHSVSAFDTWAETHPDLMKLPD